MGSPDRLFKLKFMVLDRRILAECKAIGIQLDEHPEFDILQQYHIQLKKLDKKWLSDYLKIKR